MSFCKVALPLPLREAFDYRVPAGVSVVPGQRVRVPFGPRRLVGVVTELMAQSQAKGMKELDQVLDVEPSIAPGLMRFTRWIADYYLCGWGEALALAQAPSGKPKPQDWLEAGDKEALQSLLDGLKTSQKRSRAALEHLQLEALLQAQARREGLSPGVLEQALAGGALKRSLRDKVLPVRKAPAQAQPTLTAPQAAAAQALADSLQAADGSAFLLFGVTGSGKTEVYLQALEQCLSLNKSAIVLVPEIALTPQTWQRFEGRFPGQVAVLHSGLGPAERVQAWAQLASGEKRVALGARSALFAPLKHLGLLIVDEESEPSYKQENAPRYHARDAALMRAKLEGAVCVLGSATPSFEAFQNARLGKLKLLTLPGRVQDRALPTIRFVDLNAWERKEGDEDDVLSPELSAALKANLAAGKQSLVFLNRRGFAPAWACAACGQAVECGDCSIPMTFHRGGARGEDHLKCHLCGKAQRPPRQCGNPKCGKPLLRALGTGTQKLEIELKRLLPAARMQRVDRDTATGAAFHEALGSAMHARELDVLMGTQMLAKGLDFPGLTLVGVVNADAALSFPDFRATERAFQLLVQVAGRAGRAADVGRVLVQTRQPSHDCLQAAAKQDFVGFFDSQIAERREFGYPPFGRLAALLFKGKDKAKVEQRAAEAAQALGPKARELKVEVLGPAPAPLVQVKGDWRYRLLLKCASSKALHSLLDPWCFQWKDRGVSLSVDVDAVHFL